MKKIIIATVAIIAITAIACAVDNRSRMEDRQGFANHMQSLLNPEVFVVILEGKDKTEIKVTSPAFCYRTTVTLVFDMFNMVSNLKEMGFTKLTLTDNQTTRSWQIN